MRLDELPGYLRALQDAAAHAVVPAADAMAGGFGSRVSNATLKRVIHGPGVFYKAIPGQPPATASGNLAGSVRANPARFTAIGPAYARASAMVGAYARYAAIQEWGGWTEPRRHKYMHWVNSAGPWWKKHVDIPQHPYFRPTVEAMIRDGSLSRLAASAFYRDISRFYRF